MVLSPDEHLNLRADIKATLQSLDARIRAGGNWRGSATVARSLATKLDALAALDDLRGERVRFQFPEDEPDNPVSRGAARRHASPPTPPSRRRRIVITQAEPPALGPGAA